MKADQNTMKISGVEKRALQCCRKNVSIPLTQKQKEQLREEKYLVSHSS